MKSKSAVVKLSFFAFLLFTACSSKEPNLEKLIDDTTQRVLNEGKNGNQLIAEGRRLLALAQKSNYSKGIGDAYLVLGKGYAQLNNYGEAFRHYLKSLEIRQSLSDEEGMAAVYYHLGVSCWQTGLNQESAIYYAKGLAIQENYGLVEEQAKTHRGLGLVYQEQRKWDMAEQAYKKALQIRQQQGNKVKMAWLYNDLAVIEELKLTNEKKTTPEGYISVLQRYQLALSFSQEVQASEAIGWATLNVGRIYSQLHQPANALTYLRKAIHLLENQQDTTNLITALNSEAETYLQVNNPKKALEDYQRAEKLAAVVVKGERNLDVDMSETYGGLKSIYQRQKDFTKVAWYANRIETIKKERQALNDHLLRNQLQTQLVIKEAEKSFYNRQVEALRNMNLILRCSLLVALVLGLIGVKFYWDIRRTLLDYRAFTSILLKRNS